ncbi:MAG: hypothetical protein KGL39_12175 [Patescibacteria group bacterium]|nr:hypothetical protein [Patescibacteria group bacterium]
MKYRTILADPPWPVVGDSDALFRPWCGRGGRRGRDTFFPYSVQPLEWIYSLPIADLAESDAHLYLWVPAKFNREGIGVRTAREWGFECVSEIVWAKPNYGLGKFPRPQHEILLVCRRGTLPYQVNDVGSVQGWRREYSMSHGSAGKKHSTKPEGARDLIELASPSPYLELFARSQRLGWDTWGNECFNHVQIEAAV